MCRFPFDELACRIEIGSWRYTLEYIRPVPMNGKGWTVGGSRTAGARFEEFRLDKVNCLYYKYDGDETGWLPPGQNMAVLFYDVVFHRAWRPYILTYVIIQIVLNFLGFSVFWLPGGNGGRIGMGITALLTGMANNLTVSTKLPFPQEWTWVSRFTVISFSFSAACLFESVAVHYFFFSKDSDLTPLLFSSCGINLCRGRVPGHHEPDSPASPCRHGWHSDSWKKSDEPKRKDAEDFLNRIEEENNQYWQKVARWIDEFARWVIPSVYIVVVGIMLGTVEYHSDKGLIPGPKYEGYLADDLVNITRPTGLSGA